MFRSRDLNAPPPPLYLERPDPEHAATRQIVGTIKAGPWITLGVNASMRTGTPYRTLAVGIDAFNAPNHVDLTGYVGNMQSPFFGQATSAQAARRLQLTLRFEL